jgi:ATP-dependent Clp protease adaptor protein ClpS
MSEQAATIARPVPRDETRDQVRHAPRYRVLVHNDDVTPMDFVVQVIRTVFRKPLADAVEIMWHAHRTNIAHVDTLPLEQAEFRVDQAHSMAHTQKLPLRFSYEPEN